MSMQFDMNNPKMQEWFKDIKVNPYECCNLAKRDVLDDLDRKMAMAKIYLKGKTKKFDKMEGSINMIASFVVHSDCISFTEWIEDQVEDNDPAPELVKIYQDFIDCYKKQRKEFIGELNTRRSRHWEETGELI